MNRALLSSNTNEWSTPRAFYAALDAEFHFNLDPCSTRENRKCAKFFTIEDDGLQQDWGGIAYFAIRLTGGKSPIGSASVPRRQRNPEPSSLCLFRPGPIRRISTTIFTTAPGKSGLFAADSISTRPDPRRSRQWLSFSNRPRL